MLPNAVCPEKEQLRRSLDPDDPMPDSERQSIEKHVESCNLGCKDSVAEMLRGYLSPPPSESLASLPRARGIFLSSISAPTQLGARVDGLVEQLVDIRSAQDTDSGDTSIASLGAPPLDAAPFVRLGRYKILGRLGAGGMGVVYRAHDPHLGRDVAIKLPRFEDFVEPGGEAQQRFLREAKAAAAVRHPDICPVYDVGEEQGRPYVVMAYIEGETLHQRLQRQGRFEDPVEAVNLVLRVAEALCAIHAAGIVHRDLKPENILLDRSGGPFLTDFGLAQEARGERLTAVGQILGTPGYMAPEQVAPELGPLGPAADQYALGVVLYQLLTGRRPFEGSLVAQFHQLVTHSAPPPSALRRDLDRKLEAIVLKALARLIPDRYDSVKDMAHALRSWTQISSRDAIPSPGIHSFSSGQSPRIDRDLETHALYQKARHHWNKRTEAGLRKSITYYNLALDREPEFALAWVGLADSYHQLGHWGLAPPNTAYPRGKSAALKALELDDTLTEARLALAVILKDYDWDFAGAERAFQIALQQRPDHAMGHQWYGQCLACMGRPIEAIAELRRAKKLDPLALIHDAVLGRHGHFFAREYDQARHQLLQTVQTDAEFWIAQNFLAWVYLFQGEDALALSAFERAHELDDNPETLVGLGYGYAVSGQTSKALNFLAVLSETTPQRYMPPVNLALIHTALGDKDQAFEWLNKACDDHSQWLSEIRVDPAFDPLRCDARFERLIERMNIKL